MPYISDNAKENSLKHRGGLQKISPWVKLLHDATRHVVITLDDILAYLPVVCITTN